MVEAPLIAAAKKDIAAIEALVSAGYLRNGSCRAHRQTPSLDLRCLCGWGSRRRDHDRNHEESDSLFVSLFVNSAVACLKESGL